MQSAIEIVTSLESSASIWDSFSFWLVVIGAVLAGVGGLTSIASRRINRQLSALTEARNREEKQANERAIADANARAEEAKRDAAKANLELTRIKLPRTLTDEQQKDLTDEMKAYSGQWFSLSSVQDPEAIDLVRVIGVCLQKAMWEKLEPESDVRIGDIGTGVGRGVRVRVPYGASPRTQGIAQALASALNDKGIASAFDIQHDLHRLEVIDVLAGTKPVK